MKIWLKFLIGSALGITIGILLPAGNDNVTAALQWLGNLALGIGRYAVVPVLLFSLTIAVCELRKEGKFWQMVLKNLVFIAVASVFIIFSGIIVTMIFMPGRIPIERVELTEALRLDIASNVTEIFPSNMFSVLTGGGIYLFPIYAFAFFIGLGLNYDKTYSKPIYTLIDSLSRIFYHIASFFSEILGFLLIVLSSFWAYRFRGILELGVYKDLVVMLAIFSIGICFVIMPLFLYLIKPKVNPWKILYGSMGSAFTAFFSGDINFSIPVIQRHSKENLGIRRRSNSLSLALFSTFCRCGSAVVAASAFIVIIRSYSYLTITPSQLFTIGLYAFVISFMLARHPGDGAFIALAALCVSYGGGEYNTGYLILKPLAFYLIAVGTFIDVMLTAFGSYFIARTSGYTEEKKLSHFI